MEAPMNLRGGCLCGAVRYETQGAPKRVFVCHCRDCQRAGGSAFHLGVVFARSEFKLLQGRLASFVSTADSGRKIGRSFCPTCGSGIYNEPEVIADSIVLRAGTLDDPEAVAPTYELFADSRPDWLSLSTIQQSFPRMR
jgi:hypothetical protein